MLWFPFILLVLLGFVFFLISFEYVTDPPDLCSELVAVACFCIFAAAAACVGLAMWG